MESTVRIRMTNKPNIDDYSDIWSDEEYIDADELVKEIHDALESGLIKMKDPETESKRYTSYIPYYG